MTGILDIAAERQRQIEQEGWTPEHDDQHTDGSLAAAAACYAMPLKIEIDGFGVTISEPDAETDELHAGVPIGWPEGWSFHWWKPKDRRADLVRAGALIAAEIDRLDRANSPEETPAGIGSPPQFPDGTPIPEDHHSHPNNRD